MFGSGNTTLIVSNEEINDIMKIIKSPEESRLLTKSVCEIIKNEAKEQKGGFFGVLLCILGASLLDNPLQLKAQLDQVTTFNATSSFNKF